MFKSVSLRIFSWAALLTVAAILFMAFQGAASVPLHELISAPHGLDAAGVSADALAAFKPTANAPGLNCAASPDEPLEIRRDKQTKVFEFTLPASVTQAPHHVVYVQDPIVEMVVFSVLAPDGCRWIGASGRAFPFKQRAVVNPFPNVALPDGLPPGTVVQVLIQDIKSIRPWVYLSDMAGFQQVSTTIWMGLAAFSTMLFAAAAVATGFTGLMRQSVVWSFVVYVASFLFWLCQNFSMASAGMGYWPEGAQFPIMQALAVAGVVLGIGIASIEFLQLQYRTRRAFQLGVGACAAGFVSSAWLPYGYKTGSAILGVVALAIAWTLVRKLRGADWPLKLFTLGLTATMAGGATQAASVLSGGGTAGYWPVFAFPLGAFVQGILWMVALLVRAEMNRRTQDAQLYRDATFDALTGLYNRKTLTDKLARRIEQIQNNGSGRCVLIFLGLDRFKLINDSLGHLTGDELLRQAAQRLQSTTVRADCLARFGGDEFLLLLHCNATEAEAVDWASRIQASFKPEWQIGGRQLHVTASMGVVLVDQRYQAVSDVLRDADTALHRAKEDGPNQFVLFDHRMRDEVEKQFRIESELGHAIDERQFELYYQPIVHLSNGRHAGFEALVRWRHPVHGMVPPVQFIEIAEASGHIRALGTLIIEMAMEAISTWKSEGIWQTGWYVSINVSGGQLVDASLLSILERQQQALGIDDCDIRLELTETAVISNLVVANQIFPVLRDRGMALCMDDFGTGYSSLSYLSVLPFQIIKIDKSFVDGLMNQPQQRALIKAMLSLARELNMRVVAEGIELPEQAETLAAFGCDYGQGYHFARPLAIAAATEWLQADARR